MIPEDRLKAAVVKASLGETTLELEIDKLLGKPWDDELETFRHAGDGVRRALAAPGRLSRASSSSSLSSADVADQVVHVHEVLGGLVLDPYAEVPARALEDLHHRQRVDAQVVDEGRAPARTSSTGRPVTSRTISASSACTSGEPTRG